MTEIGSEILHHDKKIFLLEAAGKTIENILEYEILISMSQFDIAIIDRKC